MLVTKTNDFVFSKATTGGQNAPPLFEREITDYGRSPALTKIEAPVLVKYKEQSTLQRFDLPESG